MALIKTYIYLISTALFYPVLVLLAALSVWALLLLGFFCADAYERLRLIPLKQADELLAAPDPHRQRCSYAVRAYLHELRALLEHGGAARDLEIEHLLQQHRRRLDTKLDKLMILVRTGPGLGLIGTLIPMGTGLAALGQGDMTRLAADLVVAFTTTVVGMAVGLLAYVLHSLQKRWHEEDLLQMELATELLVDGAVADPQDATQREQGARAA